MPPNRGWCLVSEWLPTGMIWGGLPHPTWSKCHGKEIQRQRKMLAQLLGWGNLWFSPRFFLETAWTYGNWSPDVPQSPDFLEAAYFHMFFLKISIIIIIYYPMVFSLRNFFWSVIFLRNFQGISHHFTGTLWIFQFVAEAVFPIISLEPYEFSNL